MEPRVEHANELRVALREVGVGDATAAREQVEGERHRVHVRVVPHAREVGGALAGGLLEALDDRLALELVVHERALEVARVAQERLRERDRVLHRQLGARPDREMRGVGGVAQQHDVAAVPALVAHEQEARPQRAVGHEAVALQLLGEQRLARAQRLGLVHLIEAQRAPRVLRGFDDPRAGVLVEGVGVDLDEPGLGLLEDEGEGVEHEVGAEPDVLAALRRDAFAEVRRVGLAHEAVDAVRADDEVRVRELAHLAFEAQVDAQPVRPPLQDLQEQLPWDGRERVAARAHLAPAVVDVDRRPAREGVGDLEVGFRVGVAQGAQGFLGEDDAEPEGRVGRVALEDRDVVARLPHQDREIQARRTGTDDAHLHASTSASRSNCPMSATVGNRISSSQPASS